MKFAFVVNNYAPRIGGVELHVQSLAQELVRCGNTVLIVTLGDTPGERSDDGIEVITFQEHFRVGDVLGFPSPGTSRKIRALLQAHAIDIVSTHTRFFPLSFIGVRVAKRLGIPSVHTEHGSDHVSSPSALIRVASRWVDYTFGRYVLRHATRVLGVSENVVAFVKRLSNRDATVFYNAIMPSHTERIGSHKMNPDRVVFVGRLVPGKGWETFLRVFEAIQAWRPTLHAVVVGDGPDYSEAVQLAEELKISDAVSFAGRLAPEEVRRALSGSTLVNPTTLSEGFQTTILESLAEGGRVVSYPTPGVEILLAEGAPVSVTAEPDLEDLNKVLSQVLKAPWIPASEQLMGRWYWPFRVKQYVDIARATIAASRAV